MRMWMVDARSMCDRHLLGEHVELHMLAGTLARKRSIDGYIANGLLEPASIHDRHAQLVEEMAARGFSHRSPLPETDMRYLPGAARNARVDVETARWELTRRCERCRAHSATADGGR